MKLSKDEVVFILENFINETGEIWEWDDFISIPIENKELNEIRILCASLREKYPPLIKGYYCNDQGVEFLRNILSDLKNNKNK